MRRVKRKDLYIFLIGVFAFLGIGYAFLTTDLSINGTATMVSNSWDIHFDHLVVQNGSVEIGTGDTAASITSPTTISFAVTLAQPGDYYEFLVDIVNDGTLPGVISSIDIEPFDVLGSKIFGYSYLYDSGRDVKPGDIIDPSSSKTTDFKVFYKDDIDVSDLPSTDVQQSITVTITFEQSDHVEKKACTYNGTLTQGAEFVDGQYTYRYMQENAVDHNWENMAEDGWGVRLTNYHSTDPVTTQMCGSINGKPIVSGKYAFLESNASNIDLTKLYTSDMKNMMGMFRNIHLNSFDGSLLDTSSATSMFGMFANSTFDILDISCFDTSHVTNMTFMFGGTEVSVLDLSYLDTSQVTTAEMMFQRAIINDLNLSNFGGSSLLNTEKMFYEFTGNNINFTNMNTSHVTNMRFMFYKIEVDSLDLSSFDTSSVIDMRQMFNSASFSVIDVSSFDTSNVTDMNGLFMHNSLLTTIYASNSFYVPSSESQNVVGGSPNLVGGQGTVCSGYPSDDYARIDNPPDAPGCFTAKP